MRSTLLSILPIFACKTLLNSNKKTTCGSTNGFTTYPWNIGVYRGQHSVCTGTLIDANFILVTASCLSKDTPDTVKTITGKEYEIKSEAWHPGFNPETFENNIALVYIEEEADETPVCLQEFHTRAPFRKSLECLFNPWNRFFEFLFERLDEEDENGVFSTRGFDTGWFC